MQPQILCRKPCWTLRCLAPMTEAWAHLWEIYWLPGLALLKVHFWQMQMLWLNLYCPLLICRFSPALLKRFILRNIRPSRSVHVSILLLRLLKYSKSCRNNYKGWSYSLWYVPFSSKIGNYDVIFGIFKMKGYLVWLAYALLFRMTAKSNHFSIFLDLPLIKFSRIPEIRGQLYPTPQVY